MRDFLRFLAALVLLAAYLLGTRYEVHRWGENAAIFYRSDRLTGNIVVLVPDGNGGMRPARSLEEARRMLEAGK